MDIIAIAWTGSCALSTPLDKVLSLTKSRRRESVTSSRSLLTPLRSRGVQPLSDSSIKKLGGCTVENEASWEFCRVREFPSTLQPYNSEILIFLSICSGA